MCLNYYKLAQILPGDVNRLELIVIYQFALTFMCIETKLDS